MPMIKFSIILPCVQVPLAVGLWEWGTYQPHSHSFGSWPTAGLVCYGINAPAILLSKLAVYPFRMMYPPHFLSHYSLLEWAFFAGVAVVWFLVGLALDRKTARAGAEVRLTMGRVLRYVLLVLVGIFLFLQALQGFSLPWHQGNYWGTITESILFLAWSVVLIGIPILSLIKQRRHRI
jgi:hypothetical protein